MMNHPVVPLQYLLSQYLLSHLSLGSPVDFLFASHLLARVQGRLMDYLQELVFHVLVIHYFLHLIFHLILYLCFDPCLDPCLDPCFEMHRYLVIHGQAQRKQEHFVIL